MIPMHISSETSPELQARINPKFWEKRVEKGFFSSRSGLKGITGFSGIPLADDLGIFFGRKYLADQMDYNFLHGDRLLEYGVGYDNDCMEQPLQWFEDPKPLICVTWILSLAITLAQCLLVCYLEFDPGTLSFHRFCPNKIYTVILNAFGLINLILIISPYLFIIREGTVPASSPGNDECHYINKRKTRNNSKTTPDFKAEHFWEMLTTHNMELQVLVPGTCVIFSGLLCLICLILPMASRAAKKSKAVGCNTIFYKLLLSILIGDALHLIALVTLNSLTLCTWSLVENVWSVKWTIIFVMGIGYRNMVLGTI
uniref:G-protein coupled receptors family 1 profile domain-containing protein n=1 Tax=Romanomermis culicivorax TaxID=13658 RepID=A0A915KMB3_ROMCU